MLWKVLRMVPIIEYCNRRERVLYELNSPLISTEVAGGFTGWLRDKEGLNRGSVASRQWKMTKALWASVLIRPATCVSRRLLKFGFCLHIKTGRQRSHPSRWLHFKGLAFRCLRKTSLSGRRYIHISKGQRKDSHLKTLFNNFSKKG